jgi:hypothetical protein
MVEGFQESSRRATNRELIARQEEIPFARSREGDRAEGKVER